MKRKKQTQQKIKAGEQLTINNMGANQIALLMNI